MRQQIHNQVVSMIPICILMLVLTVQPFFKDLAHLRAPAFPMLCMAAACAAYLKLAEGTDKSKLPERLRTAGQVHLSVRTVVHVLCIIFEADTSHLFLKVLSMVWLPTAAVKTFCRVSDFRMYMVAHNILVVLRFYGNSQDAGVWLATTLFLDKILLDLAGEVEAQSETRSALAAAHRQLEAVAETTTKHLFQRFCDSTVTLDDALQISEPAPQLAAMLGLLESKIEGRNFSSVVAGEDAQRFIDHMETISSARQSEESGQGVPDYIQVSLMDAYTQPVPVHIFHACFRSLSGKPTHFIGISETWRPPKTKQAKPLHSRRPGMGMVRHSASGGMASLDHGGASGSLMPQKLPSLDSVGSTSRGTASATQRRGSPRPSHYVHAPEFVG